MSSGWSWKDACLSGDDPPGFRSHSTELASSLDSDLTLTTPSPNSPPSQVLISEDQFVEREWRKFLGRWNQPILRLTVAKCTPGLVGIMWHNEFLNLAHLAKFPDRLCTGDVQAISATRRLMHNVLGDFRVSAAAILLALFLAHRYRCIMPVGRAGTQYRVFVVSLILAHKYTEDHPYSNRVWARFSELPIDVINAHEREFLSSLEHRIAVRLIEFQQWVVALDSIFGWTFASVEGREDYRTLPLPPTPEAPIAINAPTPVKTRESLKRDHFSSRPVAAGRRYSNAFML